ncbi:MAG: nicotinate-nucleotide pyrophosphorylase [Proteobacteria bacterium SG_bin7]|nr:MAG: nicotinate-nucleotide pyrophosphorylase [Proteobacteria bacterium SG_bin7]
MELKQIVDAALNEDMPNGDITTDSLGIEVKHGRARLLAKEDLVLSGSMPFEKTLKTVEPNCQIQWYFRDGDLVLRAQTIAVIEGNLVQILKGERVALNFLGHLSGIATFTKCFVNELGKSKTKLLDTRKTLPLFRDLEKQAVVHGGGNNHRKNLSDAIMIKNNHIAMIGGMGKAVSAIRQRTSKPIEVEARTLEEVKQAINLNIDRILLDNMPDPLLKEALQLIPKSISTEASGNMTLARIKTIASLGLNYISVGAITHSAPVADVSLHFDWEKS